MLHAVARHPPRADLAALGGELPQHEDVLVVDVVDLVLAEDAELALALLLPLVVFVLLGSLRPIWFTRHPVESPRSIRPPPAPRPTLPSRSHRKTWKSGWPWSRWRWPTSGLDRGRRPR